MPQPGKPKKCGGCTAAKLSPAEKLEQMIETRTTVCFQAWDGWSRHAFRGIFPGAVQGMDAFLKSLHLQSMVSTLFSWEGCLFSAASFFPPYVFPDGGAELCTGWIVPR